MGIIYMYQLHLSENIQIFKLNLKTNNQLNFSLAPSFLNTS